MIAAIYARKSNDQSDRDDEEKSVTRQVDHATAYATRKGWTVDPAHVYTDDAISGAIFGEKRPGLYRLLNALTPRPPFQVLIVMDQSPPRARAGRGARGPAPAHAGGRPRLLLLDRHGDQARDRRREVSGQRGGVRGRDGPRAGPAADPGRDGAEGAPRPRRRGHRVRVPQRPPRRPRHARDRADRGGHLRRIFEACAAGQGFVRIAKTLNAAGVPGPRGRSWAPTAIREMLYRDLYRRARRLRQNHLGVQDGAPGEGRYPAVGVDHGGGPGPAHRRRRLWTRGAGAARPDAGRRISGAPGGSSGADRRRAWSRATC